MIHANASTRLTLYNAAGTPVARWTFQAQTVEGRGLSFEPVAKDSVGGLPLRRRVLTWWGFRLVLSISWSHGLTSVREAWTGSDWGPPQTAATALGVAEAIQASRLAPVLIQPFLADPWPAFLGRAYGQGLQLEDAKGLVHTRLSLRLEAATLTPRINALAATGWGIGPWGLNDWGM